MTIPAGRPPLSQPNKLLMAIRILWFFSSLARDISHSFTNTQNTTERVKEKNKQTRTWFRSKRKRGSLWHFLCILWANASVYSSGNSQKATSNDDLSSGLGQPGICRSTVLAAAYWLLLTGLLSARLSSPDWPVL